MYHVPLHCTTPCIAVNQWTKTNKVEGCKDSLGKNLMIQLPLVCQIYF